MFAVAARAPPIPGLEDRADGAEQLIGRRLGHPARGPGLRHGGVPFCKGPLGRKPFDPGLEHDARVHLVEAPMRVTGEDRVAAFARECRLDLLVDPEIEHRIQHARHADGGAGADGQQQRALGRAETTPGLGLQHGDADAKLVGETVRQPRLPRDRRDRPRSSPRRRAAPAGPRGA